MEFKVEGSRRNRKFVEAILPSMLSQLKLESCRKGLLVRIHDECEDNSGVTLDLVAVTSCYLIIIKPNRRLKEIGLTLAHEMVHVKQMAKGTLKTAKNGDNIWANRRYPKKTKYLDRPWEVEAFSRQELILRRAIED